MSVSSLDTLGGKPPSRLLLPAAVFALAALMVSGWVGSSWWNAAHGEPARVVQARDSALEAAAQVLVNFHTVDHRAVDQGLDTWERSATGPLLDELRNGRERSAQALRESRTVAVGRTVSESLVGLDLAAGKAQVIGVVEISSTPPQGAPVTKRERVQAEMRRTDTGWKLSALAPVAVGA